MVQRSPIGAGEEVREESSWRYPLIILGALFLLSFVILLLYVGPGVNELQGNTPRPSSADRIVRLSVGDVALEVPENYTVYPRERRGGPLESLRLHALLPRLEGYAPALEDAFETTAQDGRRVDIVLYTDQMPFTEDERFRILYRPQVIGGPKDAPYDLTEWQFRQGTDDTPASGYSDKVMFTGQNDADQNVILFCYREGPSPNIPPDCYRQFEIADGVTAKYYFKRPRLENWRTIDTDIRRLLGGFRAS